VDTSTSPIPVLEPVTRYSESELDETLASPVGVAHPSASATEVATEGATR
jgi:glycine betaine/proline transport system ATP-binding protein